MSKVTTLYVSNLSTTIQEDVLRIFFSQFGDITKCVIVKNPHTGEPRGFAFIQFKERASCDSALEGLNEVEFAGQKLAVVLAKPPLEGVVKRKVGKNFNRGGKTWTPGMNFSGAAGPVPPFSGPNSTTGGNFGGGLGAARGGRGRRGRGFQQGTWSQTSGTWGGSGNWNQNTSWNQNTPTWNQTTTSWNQPQVSNPWNQTSTNWNQSGFNPGFSNQFGSMTSFNQPFTPSTTYGSYPVQNPPQQSQQNPARYAPYYTNNN
uniref:RRM domain-containing protein n=1 Tax=Arcella intermedia TaxID=1963864 RepID=A0A6B2LEC4_9EUKA